MDAEDLELGDRVASAKADGSSGEVEEIEIEQTTREMYNLTVDEAHTFYVGDGQWLVHNDCDSATLAQNLGGVKNDRLQAHHLIPCQYACKPFVERAKNAGWDMDQAYNGVLLPDNPQLASSLNLPVHNTRHRNYSNTVEEMLDNFERIANRDNYSDQKAFQELYNFASRLRSRISNMGGNAVIR